LETQKSCESNELKIKEVGRLFQDFKIISIFLSLSKYNFLFEIEKLKSNLKSSHSDRENLTVELNNLIKIKQAEQENKVL
jgi:hypothetical protein